MKEKLAVILAIGFFAPAIVFFLYIALILAIPMWVINTVFPMPGDANYD